MSWISLDALTQNSMGLSGCLRMHALSRLRTTYLQISVRGVTLAASEHVLSLSDALGQLESMLLSMSPLIWWPLFLIVPSFGRYSSHAH